MSNKSLREGADITEATHIPTASTVDAAPQHTKGPWRVGVSGNLRVYGPDGQNDDSGLIASVFKGRANANLIAAAPELLAACKEIASFAQSWQPLSLGDIASVRAAIAKAEGR